MRKLLHTDTHKRRLIRLLIKKSRSSNAKIWRYVAELLSKPARRSIRVNLSKINRYTSEGDIVLVPGKVLGAGVLHHKITIAAYSFSKKAIMKLQNMNSRIMTIEELLEENPRGSNVKIII